MSNITKFDSIVTKEPITKGRSEEKSMNIKMVVTDLDNTLLQRDKTVSEYTADVFQRIRNRGILTAFATARDFRFVTEYITPRTGITPDILIADNGALAFCNGKEIYKKMIPSNTVKMLMPRFKLIRCISTQIAYYLSGEYSNDHWSIGKRETVITDFSNTINEDALFLDGNTGNLPTDITEEISEIRFVSYSDVDLITVVHSEATKLKALIAVQNALNMNRGDIAVFGDDYNDIELLSNYDNSVAVANAINECKVVAKYICDTNENDGVAKWIKENLLK